MALLDWICRRSDKGRGRGRIRGRINAVVVIRERAGGELSRFDNSQNVKMSPSPTVKLQRFGNSRNVEMTDWNANFTKQESGNSVMYDRRRTGRVGVGQIRA